MVVSAIYDHDARLRSYEILAEAVPPEQDDARERTFRDTSL